MSETNETQLTQDLQAFSASIRSRRTINLFKPDDVPQDIVRNAIEVARWAPNHKKTEPWHFSLLGPQSLARVKALITDIKSEGQDANVRKSVAARLDAIPGWLVLSCDSSSDRVTQMEDLAACACAAQNMMLILWRAGVGVKWTTGKVIRDPRFFDIVEVDINEQTMVGLFWYGYPAHIPEQTRKPLTQILRQLD